MLLRFGLTLAAFTAIAVPVVWLTAEPVQALEAERYTVYCADDRIEVSFWDLEQMKVRRGFDVCQFMSYTSYSDAIRFADKNFGGEGSDCSC